MILIQFYMIRSFKIFWVAPKSQFRAFIHDTIRFMRLNKNIHKCQNHKNKTWEFKFRALIESSFWGLHIFDFNLRKQKKGECKTTWNNITKYCFLRMLSSKGGGSRNVAVRTRQSGFPGKGGIFISQTTVLANLSSQVGNRRLAIVYRLPTKSSSNL